MPATKIAASGAPEWPAMQVEMWPIGTLVPYARNAKRHSPEQVEQIARSIVEFGFTMPILAAEDGTIIAGHGRVLAAQSIGIQEVPVIVARGWSDEQRRAYTLADNKLAENAEWDDDLLRLELGDLKIDGFDIGLVGFSAAEIEAALQGPAIKDGIQSDKGPNLTGKTKLRVGPYSVEVSNETFHDWIADVRAEVGDTKAAIQEEILRRLGM